MNEAMIEAIYQAQLKLANNTHEQMLNDAKQQREDALEKLENTRRANYRAEQQFFNQG